MRQVKETSLVNSVLQLALRMVKVSQGIYRKRPDIVDLLQIKDIWILNSIMELALSLVKASQ
jgi:hypothetical protein